MKRLHRPFRKWAKVGLLTAFVFLFGVGSAAAQAAAEYAGALSAVSGVGASGKATKSISFPTPSKGKPKFLHVPAGVSGVDEEANRRSLQAGAGEEAGTLLLRSESSKAGVWVDGKRVGSTPLLLILPPGSYSVEMRGRRTYAQRQVEIAAGEKQEVVLALLARYPAQVRLR